jgi:arsenate reductase
MKLLFICTHNACRSILSEVITRELAAGRINVASAGASPASRIHPLTLAWLQDHNYSTHDLHSKQLDAVRSFAPDVVITVCDSAARESCPVWLGDAIKSHWSLPDPSQADGPSGATTMAFDAVVATIQRRIRELLAHTFETMTPGELSKLLNTIGAQA